MINAFFGKGHEKQKRRAQVLFSCRSSCLLDAQLLSFCPRLLICFPSPPVTTWFSFTRDNFSLGKIWKAIKKNKLFLGHHQFQFPGGYLNNNFSLASVKGETWSPKVIPSITPKLSSGQQPHPQRGFEAALKWPPG